MACNNKIQIQLRQEHDTLRAIMQRFAVAMRSTDPTDRAALLHDRVAFSQLFNSHSIMEQRSIAALPADRLTPGAAAAIREHDAGMLALRRDYSAHINFWKPDLIAQQGERYAAAVLALQERLKGYMVMEEEHILPLFS